MKRIFGLFVVLLLLFSVVSCTRETPDVDMIWMRYARHKPTELWVWQKIQTYRDGKVEDLQALGEDEDGFLLTNLEIRQMCALLSIPSVRMTIPSNAIRMANGNRCSLLAARTH